MEQVAQEIEVAASPEDVYALWKDPDTFVEIVPPLDDAELEGDTLYWSAAGPLGLTMTGEARITEDDPPHHLAWETVDGALEAHGEVRLEPAGDGTRLSYSLTYSLPGGSVGSAVAKAVADPAENVRTTLERVKQIAEERAARA